jgi:hypothetical protein
VSSGRAGQGCGRTPRASPAISPTAAARESAGVVPASIDGFSPPG